MSVVGMKQKTKMPNRKVARRPLPDERVDNQNSLLYNRLYEKLVGEDYLITLKCSICFEFFHDPTVLPCGHTFCGKCLSTMAQHAKLNARDPPHVERTIGCPSCREHVLVSSLINRETTLNYPMQQIIDIMMKREEYPQHMLYNKPEMVDASTSYDKADFLDQQMEYEYGAREKMMDTVKQNMDRLACALSSHGNVVSDAFLDIETIRADHLHQQREIEVAAAKARAEKKYGGKTQETTVNIVNIPHPVSTNSMHAHACAHLPGPATSCMLDPAIVSYSMFQQRPSPIYNDYVMRAPVPVFI